MAPKQRDFTHTGNAATSGGDARTFNAENQITAMGGYVTPLYDNNGNMIRDERGVTCTYDAWNRMVLCGNDDVYSFDATGRRPGLNICGGIVTDSYYSINWQDIEDDTTNPYSDGSGCGAAAQSTSTYVWSLSYIDDMVARDYFDSHGVTQRI